MLSKKLKRFIFLDAHNLIRTELVFAILFGEFFALLFKAVADVDVYYTTVHIFSCIVFGLFIVSFFEGPIKRNLRSISNSIYVSGILYILYVAYSNQFNSSSLFAVIIVYGFFSFMLSSVKVFWRLTAVVISALLVVLVLLNFKTITPLYILFTSISLLIIAGFALTSARVYYQNRIKDREHLLKHIFNSSHMGFILIDEVSKTIDNINDIALSLFEFDSRNELKKLTADRLQLNNHSIIDNNLNKSIELEDNRIVRVNTQKINYKNKSYLLVFLDVFKSIKELKESLDLKKLQEQYEQSYQYLFEENSSYMCIIDEGDVVLDINQSFSEFVGLSKERIIKEGFGIFTISEPENRKELNQKARDGEDIVFEKIIKDKDGNAKRLEIELRRGFYFGRKVLISNGRDITERVNLQREALLANERYKKIANDSAIGFAITDMQGKITECNNAFLKIIGYKKEEIIGTAFEKISHPGDLELNTKLREKLLSKEFKVGEIEKRYYHKNGSIVYALLKLFYEEDEKGEENYFFAQIVDITQIRNAQKEVELSERSYRELFDSSDDLIFIIDASNTIIDINSSIIKNLKYKKSELLNKDLDSLSAPGQSDRTELIKDLNKVRSGDILNRVWWVCKSSGEVIPVKINIRKANYFQKTVLIINGKDISDSYYFERKLKEKEKRYRELFERNLAGVYRTSINGEILECNPAFLNILGYSDEEVKSKSFNANDTYSSEKNRQDLLKEVEEKSYLRGKKLQLKRKGGEIITVLLNVSKITDENKQFLYYEGSIIDISELESIQNQLLKSEKKYRELINSSYFGIIIFTNYKLVFANEKAILALGYRSYQEIEGSSLDKYLIEEDLNNLKEAIEANNEDSWSFSNYSLIKKNGEISDIEGIPSPTQFDGKDSFQLSFLDMSDKRKMEAAVEKVEATERFNKVLQKELAEKEVLLKEVHHRVKNNMQVISSILSLQKSHHNDEKVKEILSESQSRIRSMALIHEKLYANKDFSKIPFDGYLQDLVTNIVQTYELKKGPVDTKFEMDNLFLNLDAAIPCGLIVNELVANSLKYAFNTAKGGILSIELKEKKEQVEIVVQDNGPGLADEKWSDSPETLGLQLVQTLCEQLNGEISMNNKNGTRFSFKFYRFESQ